MGQQNTKASTQEKSKWIQLKQRKITELEEQALSQRINFPFESIQKAVNFLEQKKYIVENGFLGVGGSALVMKACSEENDYLAIKFIINPSQTQVKACQQEFQILSQFNSPHIIKVYDIIQEQYEQMNYQILIMERCAYDLKSYLQKNIKNKKMSSNNQIYRLCLELAKGLRDLHSKNILHLDIKPGNILFGIDLKWKYGTYLQFSYFSIVFDQLLFDQKADLGISKFLDNKDHTEHLEGFTAQYSSPEQYQLANCRTKKSITKSSDIYSLGLVFMQLTGVDISQKWVYSEKLNGGNYDKCLNPNFEQFNTLIKQMVCYDPEERLEINVIVHKIKQIIKNEYDSNQNQPKAQTLKKVQSNIILQKKEDSREQTPISQSRNTSNLNILQNSVAEQEGQPKTTTKKLKIIRRPSLKLFQNDIIQQEINQSRNMSPISPTAFKQTFNSQKSGDNTPKLPQIKQNVAQFNVASGYFNQSQTPKQIVQNKYSNIKLGFSNVLAQSSLGSSYKESNSNSPLNIYHSPTNSQNSQQFQNNFRLKTPSQFFNFNQEFDHFQKQQQELFSPQSRIPLRKMDQMQVVKDVTLPKLKYENINIRNNIYQEYVMQQNQLKMQKVNSNMQNSSNYFVQKQKQQFQNIDQNQEDTKNQKRRSSSLITFQ
ncbi:hypothetical protein ABPG74_004108 [Tetrahymena malaccensis]